MAKDRDATAEGALTGCKTGGLIDIAHRDTAKVLHVRRVIARVGGCARIQVNAGFHSVSILRNKIRIERRWRRVPREYCAHVRRYRSLAAGLAVRGEVYWLGKFIAQAFLGEFHDIVGPDRFRSVPLPTPPPAHPTFT